MSSPTPLPDLETQLVDAARRLDAAEEATAPRRRWWRHGWSLLTIAVVGLGTGVAVARVAEVGPFSYMNSFPSENPRLAPTDVITVQPAGDSPAWQARASINGLGQICLTGGRRDPRTNPDAKPTRSAPNYAPQNGLTCADNEEVAQMLVDPSWPGATFAVNTPLDGSLTPNVCTMNLKTHRCERDKAGFATRMLVYGITSADGPTPVVRWGAKGAPFAMQPSKQRLRMRVDHSPLGLSKAEQRIVAGYPEYIDLVLWAADVKIPDGVEQSQAVLPYELIPHGVDDATIEMLSADELTALDRRGRREGWKYTRHIDRDARPVKGTNAAQRRWIAAFSRPRRSGDSVPRRLRTDQTARQRLQFGAARKLDVVGGGVVDVWIAPGAMPEDTDARRQGDMLCLLGARVFSNCKFGQSRWTRPFVEAVACATGEDGSFVTLVWALTPPGAKQAVLTDAAGGTESLAAGELLAVRRAAAARIEAVTWLDAKGAKTRVAVPWPKGKPARCGPSKPAGTITRKDNAGSYEESGPPPGLR